MSWNLGVVVPAGEDAARLLQTARDKNPGQEATAEARHQINQAIIAVAQLVGSGSLGDPASYEFNVNISGHANITHAPTPGWANDQVSVSITQRAAVPVMPTSNTTAGGAEGVA